MLVRVSPEAEVRDAGCVLSRLEEFPAPGSPPSTAGWSPAASGNGGTGRGGALQADTEDKTRHYDHHALFYPTRGRSYITSRWKGKALADYKCKESSLVPSLWGSSPGSLV